MVKVCDDKFIASLPEDSIDAARAVAAQFKSWSKGHHSTLGHWHLDEEAYQALLDFFGFLKSFVEVHQLAVEVPIPALNKQSDTKSMELCLHSLQREIDLHDRQTVFTSAYRDYSSAIPGGFAYVFLDSDYARLQELVNEIRTLTSESTEFEENHRRRLLRRIEKLQAALNRRMSSLDVFWGMLGEAGVALGKFGSDVKPLTDRIAEILRIVYRTEARANLLPSGKEVPLFEALKDVAEQTDSDDA